MPIHLLLVTAVRAATCDAYGDPDPQTVPDAPVEESSGLAASRSRPGVFFTHGDAGGSPILYAIDLDGTYLGSHLVNGAGIVDWEDLAPGPCPADGEPCLYVGDIGDNDGTRSWITVYVVREPEEGGDARRVETWDAVYPDGAQDAETLLVHPCTGTIHVVTKTGEARGTVYRFPDDRSGTPVLEKVADLVLDDARPITGGQWSPDGARLVVRTRDRLWSWHTSPDDPDGHWATAPVEVARVDEKQGESVAFALDGSLVTTDEGLPLTLQVFACDGPATTAECGFVPEGGCGCRAGPSAVGWVVLLVAPFVHRRREEVS